MWISQCKTNKKELYTHTINHLVAVGLEISHKLRIETIPFANRTRINSNWWANLIRSISLQTTNDFFKSPTHRTNERISNHENYPNEERKIWCSILRIAERMITELRKCIFAHSDGVRWGKNSCFVCIQYRNWARTK